MDPNTEIRRFYTSTRDTSVFPILFALISRRTRFFRLLESSHICGFKIQCCNWTDFNFTILKLYCFFNPLKWNDNKFSIALPQNQLSIGLPVWPEVSCGHNQLKTAKLHSGIKQIYSLNNWVIIPQSVILRILIFGLKYSHFICIGVIFLIR